MEKALTQRPSSCLKIVLFGPESTGKTTLSEDLAKYYGEPFVPEYMREYLQNKWDTSQTICERTDILPIAVGQMRAENRFSQKADRLLICDTNLLELKVYSQAYYDGWYPEELLKPALNNPYGIYFLTYIDVPWTPDDLRDRPHDREGMFQRFKDELDKYKKPYQIIKGNREERLKQAVEIIDELLKK